MPPDARESPGKAGKTAPTPWIATSAARTAGRTCSATNASASAAAPPCDPLTKGTDFQGGHITLTTGQAETGWVPFIVPDGVRITAVSWTPGWGSGGTSATWAVQGS